MEMGLYVNRIVEKWNDLGDGGVGTHAHKLQIRAFILGAGGLDVINDDMIMDFISQDLLNGY